MKQRWISILTAIALVVAMIPCASLAAEPETASGAAYAAAGEAGEPEAASEADQPADQPAAPSGQESGSGETGEPETDPEQQTEEELQLPEGQEGQAGAQEQEEPQASEPQESDADQGQEPEAAQDQQPAEEPQLSQPLESPAGETGAPELYQQQDQQPEDQRQAPYEAGYNSANQTVEVPYEVLGSAMNGKDIFLAQVLDDQGRTLAELKGKKDKAQSMMVFTMPYDVNLTAGTYSFRITLRQSWTGTEVVLEDQVVLKLDQGIQGIHLINTEIRYDGTDQGTFTLKFQNGTGDNRITSIDKVKFSTRLEDGSTTSMNLTQSTSGYTYDLDKGELYIPNAFFADRTLDPVVYFVGMDFTLANGQKITCNPLELTPDHSVPVEGFVNPGDQAWYFMYEPKTQPEEPYDVSYPGPNKTVEIPFDVFGDALTNRDQVSALVLDELGNPVAQLDGKKDNFRDVVVLTMPYDLDLAAGTYDLRFQLRWSESGEESQLDGYAALILDQAIQGIHLINTEVRYDGTDEGSYVLKFQNGTGDNRITSIDKVKFSTRLEDGSTTSMNLTQSTSGYTYDLDKGELYIPNAFFADRTLDPVVYFVGMDFTLANGQKITCNPLELTPDHSVPVEGFVNPGDQAWYFMYEPKTQPEEPYDVSYPGPNKTVEIPFDVFGDALTNRDQVSALVLDELGNPVAQLDGKKDNFRDVVVLTMPYDLDLAAGTYDLRFQLRWSESGEESQLDGYAALILDQAIQGIHLINTEVRYDGTDEGSYVLKFQNGTGDNRITDISKVWFMTRMEDDSTEGFGLRAGTDSFTWDPDRGEVTIPASSFARQELAPVVYFGMMDFTLANGETITANSLEVVPDEAVLPGDFVNDGSNNWFLINEIGVELSGSVKTWGEAEPVTLTLTKEGEGQVGEPLTLEPEVQQYVFSNLLPGTYTLTASKHNHVTRTYTIEVGDSPLEQNIELCLLGDVNGDGKVTTLDAALVNACAQQVTQLNEYAYACADVTGDGIVSTFDAARINAHAQKVSSLWN